MKTQTELQKLKSNWLNDPCWDIETTEGFEEYRPHLLMFRLDYEKKRKDAFDKKNREYADKLFLLDNMHLALYISKLEKRIKDL